MTKVSIIIPIYNVTQYLRECVDSLCVQTYTELEIILVDDGSTDGSGAICDEYAAKDERVRVIHQANRGVSAARNAGLDTAKGEYLQFVDPDDWVEPTITEHLVREMRRAREESRTDVQLAICSFTPECEHSVAPGSWSVSFTPGIKNAKDFSRIPLAADSPKNVGDLELHSCCGRLFVREIIEANGLRFAEDLFRTEDSLFMLEYFSKIDRLVTSSRREYHYRRCAESTTNKRFVRDRDFHVHRSFCVKGARHLAAWPGLSDAERREAFKRLYAWTSEKIVWFLFRFASHSTNAETLKRIRLLCSQPEFQRMLRHYRPRKGHSKTVPLLLRMGDPCAVLVALRQHTRRS